MLLLCNIFRLKKLLFDITLLIFFDCIVATMISGYMMLNKISKVIFIGLVIFFNFDVSSLPWNNNAREHLFGYIDRYNQAHVTI